MYFFSKLNNEYRVNKSSKFKDDDSPIIDGIN